MLADASHGTAGACKLAQTLKARAALRGIVVTESRDDHGRLEFIASMGALTKPFDSLAALGAWLDRVDGRRE